MTPPSNAFWAGKGFYAQETGAIHFNGQIQNLRIFDQPLTSQQVAELYAIPEIDPTHLGGILSLVFGTLTIVERRSRPSRGSVSGCRRDSEWRSMIRASEEAQGLRGARCDSDPKSIEPMTQRLRTIDQSKKDYLQALEQFGNLLQSRLSCWLYHCPTCQRAIRHVYCSSP